MSVFHGYYGMGAGNFIGADVIYLHLKSNPAEITFHVGLTIVQGFSEDPAASSDLIFSIDEASVSILRMLESSGHRRQ